MTAFDRFDPFELRIAAAIDEIAAPHRPDYLDDVLRVTTRTPQRPRWTFPGRWLPGMDTTFGPIPVRTSSRPLVLVAIAALLALAATAVLITGARPKVPLPTGPARNGALVFPLAGDLYSVADPGSAAAPTLVLHSGGKLSNPYLSPDGRRVFHVETRSTGDRFFVANTDGSASRQIFSKPVGAGYSQVFWAPDSSYLLATIPDGGLTRLYRLAADGSGEQQITVPDGLNPWEAIPSPVDPGVFLLRATNLQTNATSLLIGRLDGSLVRRLDLPAYSAYGSQYALSGAVWSPDGRRIAYNAADLDGATMQTVFRTHVVNADGTRDRALPGPPNPRVNEAWPAFSPDGTQLLVERFTFDTDATSNDGTSGIAIVPVDGSSAGREIAPAMSGALRGNVRGWSPDGRYVVEWMTEAKATYLIDVASGVRSTVQLGDDAPDWQRLAP